MNSSINSLIKMKKVKYFFVALAIKIKGTKQIFSKSPLNYQKLRKDDLHSPERKNVLGLSVHTSQIKKCLVSEIKPETILSETIILYCHGGASVYGPTDLHWNTIAQIIKVTKTKAYLIDYPKAPEHEINEINENIDAAYNHIIKQHHAKNIILLGDSFGGTLLILLVQRLTQQLASLPKSIILITPVLDMSMENPIINHIESKDIMLSKSGVISAKKMCAGLIELKSSIISPLYGSFKNFTPTYIFIGENDIMKPDAELFVEKLKKETIPVSVFKGDGMPHIWPLLPLLVEAKIALRQITDLIFASHQNKKS